MPLYTITTQTGALSQATKAVLGIQEVPPSQAMEMGQIMPDVTE